MIYRAYTVSVFSLRQSGTLVSYSFRFCARTGQKRKDLNREVPCCRRLQAAFKRPRRKSKASWPATSIISTTKAFVERMRHHGK